MIMMVVVTLVALIMPDKISATSTSVLNTLILAFTGVVAGYTGWAAFDDSQELKYGNKQEPYYPEPLEDELIDMSKNPYSNGEG